MPKRQNSLKAGTGEEGRSDSPIDLELCSLALTRERTNCFRCGISEFGNDDIPKVPAVE
jgi:hypothetical protein